MFDIVSGLIGLVILVPLTIVIKIAYMITGDFHSVFYLQPRIGKNGKTFTIFKFRSMRVGAEKELEELMKKDRKIRKEYKNNKKIIDDPRITKVGKVIRRWSVDEMPQFLNVLIGNMSVIGNRPYLLGEREEMGEYYKNIVKVKPGITGLWQISGHNNVPFKSRLELEATYADLACLSLDIHILIRTFTALNGGNN
ncbi:sugar transferase [Candidatus Saccharibacteria bacterium]|nr:sugar transferase [Candidatus Saccharibacteria bacterium]